MTDRTNVPLSTSAREPASATDGSLAPVTGGWESSRAKRGRAPVERRMGRVDIEGALRDTWPALVRDVMHGRAKLAFTFAGQGTQWLDELKDVVASSARARELVSALATHLDQEVTRLPLADAALLDDGLPLSRWLDGERPADDVLHRAAVSAPCLFVTQMARAEALLEAGLDVLLGTDVVAGVAGHSQGTLAAACFAELWSETDTAARIQRAKTYASYYLRQGLRMEQAAPFAPSPDVVARAVEDGAGVPSPMAAVGGLLRSELELAIASARADVRVAVENAPFYQTVSGLPVELERVRRALVKHREERAKAKAKGKAPGRVPVLRWEYLPVSGPFHHELMRDAYTALQQDIEELRFTIDPASLAVPVLDPRSGEPVSSSGDLAASLAASVLVEQTSWRSSVQGLQQRGATHVIDFGPGEGVARVTGSALKGHGVCVLAASRAADRAAIVDARRAPVRPVPWSAFRPRLVELPGGERLVDNRFTRATGRPPVLLPGMTPTTVEAPIVVAAANAGYVAELAGGGQVTERILRTRLDEVARDLAPGQGIVFNALYLDPYLWGLHFSKERLVFKLKDEGYPIVGVTISAGVPVLDEAVALLRELSAHGMTWNALKPGNDAQLKEVLAIADAVPELTLHVHLEGGRAGGHHSWEDLDDLLVRNYGDLRARDNVVLAVGGGIANAEQATAYMTGEWSERLGFAPMPVDAVFLGTRLMACKEARTSDAVKEALARAPGSDEWPLDGTAAGDVTSGRSQLDASIYYLDNAAAKAGRLLDEVAGDAAKALARKQEIIDALASTAKPYFGDVEEMTYAALLQRHVELTCIGRGSAYEDGPWPDVSYRRRFEELFRRAEERFVGTAAATSLLEDGPGSDAPFAALDQLAARYPEVARARLHPDDVRFFFDVCRRPGKPVCFVPVLDENVRRWFKADSLWQAHDPRYPAHAVLAIPGPRGVQGIARADEPVADVLGGFAKHLVERLGVLSVEHRVCESRADLGADAVSLNAGGSLAPSAEEVAQPDMWFMRLRRLGKGALAAALGEANAIVVGEDRSLTVASPLRALVRPVEGASYTYHLDEEGRLSELRSLTPDGREAARASLQDGRVQAVLLARRAGFGGEAEQEVTLDLGLSWVERDGAAWLRWDREAYLDGQRSFYGHLLFGEDVIPVAPFGSALDTTALTEEQLRAFRSATRDDTRGVTPSLAFPLAWKAIFRALSGARADVLKLVHEDNETELFPAWPPAVDQALEVQAGVSELEHLPAGRRVVTRAELRRAEDGALAAIVTSRFFIRDIIDVIPGVVERRIERVAHVRLRDAAEVTFLIEQPWWRSVLEIHAGDRLELSLIVKEQRELTAARFSARGEVRRDGELVAHVDLPEEGGVEAHPVLEALKLLDEELRSAVPAKGDVGEKRIAAPRRLDAYAAASGDRNPLHLELGVARFAGFEAPIVHGMWTASAALHRVSRLAAGGDSERVRRFFVRFTAPVALGEELHVVVRAAGASRGERHLEVQVLAGPEGRPVLTGEAVVKAARTAYVFPGQGIQAPGMGMDGYARSPAAKAVWQEADGVCRRRFGFSLLDVVQQNPRELWIQGERVAHPQGVLFLTQFTQVAMAVMAVAQARELEEQGLLASDARFAGHSLGEYSALAALTSVMPLEGVVAIVYHRGLTMDRLVERDVEGRSPYAMGVVRPHYAKLDEAGAFALVDEVRRATGLPVEVVNHNVRGRQYSVTGHRDALAVLAKKLGDAWVPVPGIDVPFHSTLLRDGVDAFRRTLDAALPERADATQLEHRYVPNLTGTFFALDERFFADVEEACGSPRVADWRQALASGADRGRLAREVLVEVLAYQFASPVRWIQTQERLFGTTEGVESYVEVGAAHQPTLANMARATLAAASPTSAPTVLHSELDRASLAGPLDVEHDAAPVAPVTKSEAPAPAGAANDDTQAQAPSPAAVTTPAPAPAGPAASAATLPPVSLVEDGVRTLLALQTKRRPEQVPFTDSLDALLGGNSARRNQVLADLAAELEARAVDGAHEMPLAKLVEALADKADAYRGSGPYLTKARATALSRVLGGAGVDEAQIERYLADTWKLEGGHAVVAINRCSLAAREGDSTAGGALSSVPAGRLADKAAAFAWIDQVVEAWGRELGVALAKPSVATSAVAVDSGALKDLEDRVLGDDGVLQRAARAAAAELGLSLRTPTMNDAGTAELRARVQRFEDEHGEAYEAGLAARFDARKHVAFTSWWAWGRRDLLALEARVRRGEPVSAAEMARVGGRLDESGLKLAAFLEGKARAEGRLDVVTALEVMQRAASRPVAFRPVLVGERPLADVDERGELHVRTTPRGDEPDARAFIDRLASEGHLTEELTSALSNLASDGGSFVGKTAVVTGAGAGSIALEVVKALLEGGARVVVTTSGYSADRMRAFKRVYQEHAAARAELHVVPVNQGSFTDVDALAAWLSSAEKERVGSSERILKEPWVPDLLLPFGAVGETASLVDMGGRSLSTLRVLVLGVERLVARLSEVVRDHGRPGQRVHVILPLSPNHGTFGGDGAYGESKAALEALMERWRSEQDAWGRYASLAGARIGWVRGTGLMQQNDALAALLEDGGLRTFSSEEMGLLLTGLCTDEVRQRAAERPVLADLTGGLGAVADLGERLRAGREKLEGRSRYLRRLYELTEALKKALGRARDDDKHGNLAPRVRPTVKVPMPTASDLERLPELDHLDLSRVVVIAGYGEVGPWGSARTRWDIEKDSALCTEGLAELAWTMGLIAPGESGGFIDVETKKPVADEELHERYEKRVLEHSGVRVTDPDVTGFDPAALVSLVEVHLDRDFTFPVPDRDVALAMQTQDPDNTEILDEGGRISVVRKRGAVVRVPAALKVDRRVTGQVPTGWDAARFGVPPEMVEQVDPVTLYCLLSTAEAFLTAGIEPEEIYRWMHPARVGVTVGTGIGGMKKLHRLHRDFYNGAERQNDTLQETLINVIGGYIVQSYLGSYGAMSFPVGACATGGLSVTEGIERILSGTADLIVAGGADDLSEAGLIGFADMGATANTDELAERGVEPRHMSRPSDRRRRGFVEAHGAGVMLLVRASKALEMGLPVYGVVAYAGTFGDGLQKSVPAPGQGALAAGAERVSAGRDASDACGFNERRRRVGALLDKRPALVEALGAEDADCLIDAARKEHAHDYYRNRDDISPLRGALGVLGLTPDDVGVVSKHDSSTQANDENEARLHTSLSHAMGRTEGNPLLVISQKALTGHPKGAAASWQVNGLLQAMADGVLPPNASLEDVSPEMRAFPELVLTDRPLAVGWEKMKAGLVTTLGFGHVSALLCLAHPFHFWRMLSGEERAAYEEKVSRREARATTKLQAVLAGKTPLFQKREERPFVGKHGELDHAAHETRVLLDAGARVDAASGRFADEHEGGR